MDQRKSVEMLSKSFLYQQRLGYGLGDFACNLIWQVISLYLLYFYTDVVHLGAKSIAVMFMICRVIDAITDVLVGFAIDKTKTRWGKSRPWFLVVAAGIGSMLGSGIIIGLSATVTVWQSGLGLTGGDLIRGIDVCYCGRIFAGRKYYKSVRIDSFF